MIKLLIFSLKKSRLLSKIANENRSESFNGKISFSQTIKTMGETIDKQEIYIKKLLTLLANDQYTVDLLKKYNRTFEDLRNIIYTLEVSGAGKIVKGHYVPVSSIAFIKQLNTILKHWDGENFKIQNQDSYNSNLEMANHLIQSFE